MGMKLKWKKQDGNITETVQIQLYQKNSCTHTHIHTHGELERRAPMLSLWVVAYAWFLLHFTPQAFHIFFRGCALTFTMKN